MIGELHTGDAGFAINKVDQSVHEYAEEGGKVVLEQPLEETHHGWRIVSSGDIVVGVDQSPEARWAVLWGAREARLRGATLALAHVSSSAHKRLRPAHASPASCAAD